jgi:hypothetical protein
MATKTAPPKKQRKTAERPARASARAKSEAAAGPLAVFATKLNAAREEYARLLREIDDAARDEMRGWDRKWEAVATVLAKKYFLLDDDAPSAPAWVKKHTEDEYRTALRNARVAKLASPEEEKKYTVTKIDLAYTIDEARQREAAKNKGVEWAAPASPRKLALAELRYTVERDGDDVSLGLDEVSVSELRALQRGDSAPSASASSATAKLIARAIRAQPALKNVTVAERDNELTLGKIRKDQVRALGKALSAIDLDGE